MARVDEYIDIGFILTDEYGELADPDTYPTAKVQCQLYKNDGTTVGSAFDASRIYPGKYYVHKQLANASWSAGDRCMVLITATVNTRDTAMFLNIGALDAATAVTGVPKVDVTHVAGSLQTAGDIITAITNVSTAVTAGVASVLNAVADQVVTGSGTNTYSNTYLSNGTYWIIAPATPAVAEAGVSYWINANLLYVTTAAQFINSVTIRGYFSSGAARNVNVYAYNYTTKVWDQLSDATTRMANAATSQLYTYTLLSAHRSTAAAVTKTSAGSNFSAAGTTCTASVTGHGFVTGDIVTISGITTLTNANGTFYITKVNDNQFTYTIASQTATGGGTANMTTDAIYSVRIGFKEGPTSSYDAADRLNIDQCIVNVATAGASAADISEAVKQKVIALYYPEGVWVDTTGGGAAGTVLGVNGLRTNPSSTYAEALVIAAALNIRQLRLKGGSSVTLTQSHANWQILGGTVALGSQAIDSCEFKICGISGIGTCSVQPIFEDCHINAGTTTGPAKFMRCGFNTISGSKYTAGSAGEYLFVDCYSEVAGGNTPYFNFAGTGGTTTANFRRWSGGSNITGDNQVTGTMEVVTGGSQSLVTGGGSWELRGICREVNVTLSGGEVVCIDAVTGPVAIGGSGAGSTVRVYGVTSTVTASASNPTIENASLSQATVNDQVDTALNTAIPGSPTENSVNERLVAINTATDYLPAYTAGAQNGLMICGENIGPWSVSGGVAFTNTGGPAFSCAGSTAGIYASASSSVTGAAMWLEASNAATCAMRFENTGVGGSAKLFSFGGTAAVDVFPASVDSMSGVGLTTNVGNSFKTFFDVEGATATVTTVNDKTGYVLSDAGVDAIWNEAQADHTTPGSFGVFLDAAISGRMASFTYTTPPDVLAIADAVWNESVGDHLDPTTKAGYYLSKIKDDAASILADTGTDGVVVAAASKTDYALSDTGIDAIWDEAQSGHITSGSFGLYLDSKVSDAGGSGGGASASEIWGYIGDRTLTSVTGLTIDANLTQVKGQPLGSETNTGDLAASFTSMFNVAAANRHFTVASQNQTGDVKVQVPQVLEFTTADSSNHYVKVDTVKLGSGAVTITGSGTAFPASVGTSTFAGGAVTSVTNPVTVTGTPDVNVKTIATATVALSGASGDITFTRSGTVSTYAGTAVPVSGTVTVGDYSTGKSPAEQVLKTTTQPIATDADGKVTFANTSIASVTTVTTLSNLPPIPNNWLTAAGIAAIALNGKGDWATTSGLASISSQVAAVGVTAEEAAAAATAAETAAEAAQVAATTASTGVVNLSNSTTAQLTALQQHGDQYWGSDIVGNGSVSVDHNYQGVDNLAYTAGTIGIAGAFVQCYRKDDYDAGNRSYSYIVAQTTTDTNGRWRQPMLLDPNTYVLVYFRPGYYGPDIKEITVA